MPVNGSDVKVVYYTRSAYNNLSTKDDNTIYYVQETNGRLSLYIGNRAMGYATEGYVDNALSSKQDKLIAGDNINIDENTNVISASGGGGEGRVKLLRARSGTTDLTIHSNSSVTSVGSQLQRGDTIMFEVLVASGNTTTVTPKILKATVSSTANSTAVGRSVTFTTWTGIEMRVYSLSVALSTGGALSFGAMNYMRMYKSGTDMNITNGTWTAYIGRIWKVDGDVI